MPGGRGNEQKNMHDLVLENEDATRRDRDCSAETLDWLRRSHPKDTVHELEVFNSRGNRSLES